MALIAAVLCGFLVCFGFHFGERSIYISRLSFSIILMACLKSRLRQEAPSSLIHSHQVPLQRAKLSAKGSMFSGREYETEEILVMAYSAFGRTLAFRASAHRGAPSAATVSGIHSLAQTTPVGLCDLGRQFSNSFAFSSHALMIFITYTSVFY